MRGVHLTCVPAYKFKTGCLSVTLTAPLEKKTASMNAVLPSVLRRGTARLPDMKSIAAVLDGLYGARISPVVRKRGEVQCLGFYAEFVDDEFVPEGRGVLEPVAQLMGEMLLYPATSGGRLKAEYVNGERENLISDIKAVINDKRVYAVDRLTELMCRGERYSVNELGTLADAGKISVATLTRHYREAVSMLPVEIFYCGAADPERVERAVSDALVDLPRGDVLPEMPETVVVPEPKAAKPRVYRETMDVTQGKLAIGFRLGKRPAVSDEAALLVLNALYGGCATSKLFLNVRERLSLCYYATSVIDTQKRVMLVSSGIDFAKYDEAYGEIMAQFEAVRNGQFDERELEAAKKSVMTALYAGLDRLSSTEGLYLSRRISGAVCTPPELAALAEGVTKDDILDAARNIRPDAVYFLAGEGMTRGA